MNLFFNNKSIMLRSSADKFETIFFARYLLLFGGYENRIYVEDIHKLKTLLEAVTPEVTFVSTDQLTDVLYDVEYSMQKLQWLSKDSFLSNKSFVYLQPQYLTNDKFDNLESNADTEKTGLALFDRNGKTVVDVLDFYNDLPRHKLRHKSFYPITVQDSSDSITLFGLYSNRSSEFTSDYRDITAFISRLDYLISFDNIIVGIPAHADRDSGVMPTDVPV